MYLPAWNLDGFCFSGSANCNLRFWFLLRLVQWHYSSLYPSPETPSSNRRLRVKMHTRPISWTTQSRKVSTTKPRRFFRKYWKFGDFNYGTIIKTQELSPGIWYGMSWGPDRDVWPGRSIIFNYSNLSGESWAINTNTILPSRLRKSVGDFCRSNSSMFLSQTSRTSRSVLAKFQNPWNEESYHIVSAGFRHHREYFDFHKFSVPHFLSHNFPSSSVLFKLIPKPAYLPTYPATQRCGSSPAA